jgi:hypothetical protein
MWRIVRAEIDYLKPLLVWSYIAFIAVIGLWAVRSTSHGIGNPSAYLLDLSRNIVRLDAVVPIVCFAAIFIQLFLEIRESRLRQLAILPIESSRIGLARILAPMMILALYVLLLTVCKVVTIVQYGYFASAMGFRFLPYFTSCIGSYLLSISTLRSLGLWIMMLYLLRLVSEWEGRVILGALLLYIVMKQSWEPWYQSIIHIHRVQVPWANMPGIWGAAISLGIGLALMALLHLFFMTRRSFLE